MAAVDTIDGSILMLTDSLVVFIKTGDVTQTTIVLKDSEKTVHFSSSGTLWSD